MSLKLKAREVQVPMHRMRADIAPASFNPETRTVEIIWSVGKKGLRWAPDVGNYYEELSMDPAHIRMGRFKSGNSPFKDNHGYGTVAVIGRITQADIKGLEGRGVVTLMNPEDLRNADAADTIVKVQKGFLPNTSVGYSVYKYERQPQSDKEEIPTYLAVDWEPNEVSTVPVGFDESAVVRAKDESGNNCVFINHDDSPKEIIQEARTMTEQERLEQERVAAEKIKNEQIALEKAAMEKGRAEEQARSLEIRAIASKLGLSEEFSVRMVKENKSLEEVRRLAIDEKATTQPEIRGANVATISAGEDESAKWREGASQWLQIRSGVSSAVEKHQKIKLEAGEFRGMSMMDLARESLERSGVKTRGMDKLRMVGTALTHRSGYNSTSDFAVLLENTLHKTLLASYGVTPDSWSRFCKQGQVSDFRAHKRYRQGTFGALDSLNEHGEFKNKAIPDGTKESITATTKGNIIGVTRETIVNDDMGALSDLAMRFGRAAKLSVEVDVYALLALNSGLGPAMGDTLTLFHATHANVGTGSAISAAAIDADRVVMASQLDPSSNEVLDLRPKILVVPVGLGGVAKVINGSQYDPDTVANKSQMKPNLVNGLFGDIVDTARLTGTRRYLFADPAIAPTIEVAFLDAQSEPFMETKDGFRMDGVEWKVRLDYGVAGVDYRGAVTNAGA